MHAQLLAIPDQDLVLHIQLFGERENPNLQQAFSVSAARTVKSGPFRPPLSPDIATADESGTSTPPTLPLNCRRFARLFGLFGSRQVAVRRRSFMRLSSIQIGQALFLPWRLRRLCSAVSAAAPAASTSGSPGASAVSALPDALAWDRRVGRFLSRGGRRRRRRAAPDVLPPSAAPFRAPVVRLPSRRIRRSGHIPRASAPTIRPTGRAR